MHFSTVQLIYEFISKPVMKYWLGKLIFPRFIWKNQCRFEEKQKDRFYDVIIPGNKIEDVVSYLLSRALDKIKRALHWNWPLATVHCCRISDDIYIDIYIFYIRREHDTGGLCPISFGRAPAYLRATHYDAMEQPRASN